MEKICGTCVRHDSDLCYCPLYGERFEGDSCQSDWKEDEE